MTDSTNKNNAFLIYPNFRILKLSLINKMVLFHIINHFPVIGITFCSGYLFLRHYSYQQRYWIDSARSYSVVHPLGEESVFVVGFDYGCVYETLDDLVSSYGPLKHVLKLQIVEPKQHLVTLQYWSQEDICFYAILKFQIDFVVSKEWGGKHY